MSVPFEVKEEVAVIEPPVMVPDVSDEKNAVTPFRSVVKKFVEVAFVKLAFVVKRLVLVLLVMVLFSPVRLVA